MASKSSVETCGFPAGFPQHDRQKQIAFIGEFAGYFCFPSFSVLTRFPPGFPSIIFRTATLGGPAQSDFGSVIPIKRAKATSSSVSTTGLPTGFRGVGVGAGGLARAVRKLSRHANGGGRPASRQACQNASIRLRMASEIRRRPSGVCLPDFRCPPCIPHLERGRPSGPITTRARQLPPTLVRAPQGGAQVCLPAMIYRPKATFVDRVGLRHPNAGGCRGRMRGTRSSDAAISCA